MTAAQTNLIDKAEVEAATAAQLSEAHAIRTEARKLGLSRYLLELHNYGVTVVPPEVVGTPELVERLREATLRTLAERHGQEYPHDWATRTEPFGGPKAWHYLFEDETFIEGLLHPVVRCISKFMCGQDAIHFGGTALVKTPNAPDILSEGLMGLHTDLNGMPPPYTHWPLVTNVFWVLNDFNSADDGPTMLIPGSHTWGNQPSPREAMWWEKDAPYKPVPVTAKTGSLVVWNGHTWHGSCPRTTPGMRILLPYVFGRRFLEPFNRWKETVENGNYDSWFEKHPELSHVLGLDYRYPVQRNTAGAEHIAKQTANVIGNMWA